MATASRVTISRSTSVEIHTRHHVNPEGGAQDVAFLRHISRVPISRCTRRSALHLHFEERQIHNVGTTCPLTKRAYEHPVYCRNVNAVFERAALIDFFVTQYLQNISSTAFTESSVRMVCLKTEGATSIPVLHNRLILFPLVSAPDAPIDHFQLSQEAVIYSVTEAQVLQAAALAPSACIRDDTIRELVESYMQHEDHDKERDAVLVAAIHARRTVLGLQTRIDHLCHGPDLSNLDLSGLTIRNLNVLRRTLVNTNLSNCPLIVNCCFENTRFIGCNFENSNVLDCNFGGHCQSFYQTSMQNTSFSSTNSHLYLLDDNGQLRRAATTTEEFRLKLESLGALNTATLREYTHQNTVASIRSPSGVFDTNPLVARVFSIQATPASGQAGPDSKETEKNPFGASARAALGTQCPDDAAEGDDSTADPIASPSKKPRRVVKENL